MAGTSTRRGWVVLVVLVHLLINVAHGHAHARLGVGLSTWQNLYVFTVILIAPLVALVLSFTRLARAGAWLLLASMLSSLIFGAVYHYVIISTDNVAHLPPGSARDLFRITAMLLVITEVFGVIVAALQCRRKTKIESIRMR